MRRDDHIGHDDECDCGAKLRTKPEQTLGMCVRCQREEGVNNPVGRQDDEDLSQMDFSHG